MSQRRSWIATFRSAAICLFVGLLLLSGGGERALAQTHSEQTPFLNLLTYLQNIDGDTIAQGSAVNYGGCAKYVAAFGSCFGNNSATPYFVLQVPLGGITLPSYLSGFHPTGSTSLNTFFQLHAGEALVTIITVPPLAAYYSQQTYMVERDAHWYDSTHVPGGTGCTPGTSFQTPNGVTHDETTDCNYDVFSFFNNAINDVVVNQKAGFAFSNTPSCTTACAIAIVTTPDDALYAHIKTVFGQTLGYNTNLLFEEGMATGTGTPSPLLHIDSTNYNPDIFATVFRYTIQQDGNGPNSASLAYQQQIGANILTFRVTQQSPPTYLSAVNTPTITSQACNTNEAMYTLDPTPLCATGSMVKTHLATLTTALLGWMQMHVSASYAMGAAATPPPTVGFNCLNTGIACQGGIPDTDAYRGFPPIGTNAPILHMVTGLPILGVGALHSASPSDTSPAIPANNAVYTGLSIADNKLNSGGTGENIGIADPVQTNLLATGFSSKQVLVGSAAKIFNDMGLTSNDQDFLDDLQNLYVVVFNQTVQGNNPCVIPGSQSMTSCTQFYVANLLPGSLPATDPVKISERGYLYPPASATSSPSTAMQIGANPNYMLSPNIIAVPSTQ